MGQRLSEMLSVIGIRENEIAFQRGLHQLCEGEQKPRYKHPHRLQRTPQQGENSPFRDKLPQREGIQRDKAQISGTEIHC